MGNSAYDKPLTLSEWLQNKLGELGWLQKQAAEAAGVSTATISDLIREKQALTAETAAKLAAVPEFKVTRDHLLKLAGVWREPVSSSKQEIAELMFGELSDTEQDLTLDFMVMLRQRARTKERRNSRK